MSACTCGDGSAEEDRGAVLACPVHGIGADPEPMVYRDYCNTCGAERGSRHADRCHLSGEVGAWSGFISSGDAA